MVGINAVLSINQKPFQEAVVGDVGVDLVNIIRNIFGERVLRCIVKQKIEIRSFFSLKRFFFLLLLFPPYFEVFVFDVANEQAFPLTPERKIGFDNCCFSYLIVIFYFLYLYFF